MRNIVRLSCLVGLLLLAACNLPSRATTAVTDDGAAASLSESALPTTEASPATATPEPPEPTSTSEPTPTQTPEPGPIERLPAGTVPGFSAIDMIDLQIGWAIGGPGDDLTDHHVFRTLDGGSNWLDVTPPEVVNPAGVETVVAKGAFWDADSAWVVFYDREAGSPPPFLTVWATTDGGKEWAVAGTLDLTGWEGALRVSDVFFINAKTGWVFLHQNPENQTDRIALFQTTDAGVSWKLMIDPKVNSEIQECEKTGILFTGPWNGWLAGDCHGEQDGVFLYQTFDGGKTWAEAILPNPPAPAGLITSGTYACRIHPPVFFTHATHLMLGMECTAKATGAKVSRLYSSRLNEANWDIQEYPGGFLAIRGAGDGRVFRTPVSSGIAIGEDVYLYVNEVGWEKLPTLAWIGPMDFVDWNRGWMAATDGKTRQLMISVNGGRVWEVLPAEVAGGG